MQTFLRSFQRRYLYFGIIIIVSILSGTLMNTPALSRNLESFTIFLPLIIDGPYIEQVSIGIHGQQADGYSGGLYVSADGRYVAFQSSANNLVEGNPGDLTPYDDIYIHDRQSGITEIVPLGLGDNHLVGWMVTNVKISPSGRYVAFYTLESGGWQNIYMRDRQTGTTTLISQGAYYSYYGYSSESGLDFSADERYLLYSSINNSLPPSHYEQVYLYDIQTAESTCISVTPNGNPGNNVSVSAVISGDGRYIAFSSAATDLIGHDDNGFIDAYLYDRQAKVMILISQTEAGSQANGDSASASISADGRYVVVRSTATNLTGDSSNTWADIFAFDMVTGNISLVSKSSTGTPGNSGSGGGDISADGRYIAFTSAAANLIPNDTNGNEYDVFVHDLYTGTTTCVSKAWNGVQGSQGSSGAISDNGQYIVLSTRNIFCQKIFNNFSDVYLIDWQRAWR